VAGPEILVPIGFFTMVAVIVVGGPIARAHARRNDRGTGAPKVPSEVSERLERKEQAMDSIAIEVERISEGQRFTTRLLSEGKVGGPVPRGPDVSRLPNTENA
jgi:hypothetical protein